MGIRLAVRIERPHGTVARSLIWEEFMQFGMVAIIPHVHAPEAFNPAFDLMGAEHY